MPWPRDDLVTDDLDSGADRPPRAEFFKLFQRVKAIIAARGEVNGIPILDSRGRIPAAQVGRGVPGGVASLSAAGTVPLSQLPPVSAPEQQVPPGTITIWGGGNAAPQGWHNCYGAAVSRVTYAALFAAIGTTYGAGDGVSTFNLPHLGARFPLGRGSGRMPGNTGGAATHTLTEAEMPRHHHTIAQSPDDDNPDPGNRVITNTQAERGTINSDVAGGNQAHNNMPPYLVVNFIIKW